MNQEQEQQWGGEEGAGRGATSALNHCNLQELVLARRLHNTYTHTHTRTHTHTHTHIHTETIHTPAFAWPSCTISAYRYILVCVSP